MAWTEDELFEDVKFWKSRADAAQAKILELEDIIRSCVQGSEVVMLSDGAIGLHLPNKHCAHSKGEG